MITIELIAGAAGLLGGVVVTWVIMRTCLASAREEGRTQVQTEHAASRERVRALEEERQLHQAAFADLKRQADGWREALDAARDDRAQLAERASRVPVLDQQIAALLEQQRADHNEMRRLSISDAERQERLAAATQNLQGAQAEASRLAQDLAERSSALAEASEARAALDEKAARLLVVERELRDSQDAAFSTARQMADLREQLGRAESELQLERKERASVMQELATEKQARHEAEHGASRLRAQLAEAQAISAFRTVVTQAQELCRFDDPEYKGPASYDDLLSYYNQRDHQIIDRHLIQDALAKLAVCKLEIHTNKGYASYDDQYASLLKHLDPSSSTERKFIDHLYENGLRLPDAAQKRVDGLYVQPDFYYEPRFWVFCDGTPHDQPTVQEDDKLKRQAILARGDEVWVYYYADDLATKVAARPDIFKKVK